MSSRPLIKGKPFLVKIEKLNKRWVSNIFCGVTCISPEKANFPLTALGFKKYSWIICSDWISHNGIRVSVKQIDTRPIRHTLMYTLIHVNTI